MAVLAGAGGLLVSLIIILLLLLVNNGTNKGNTANVRALSEAFTAEPIPRKELFIEEEPDFLPKVLYYQPPQSAWDAEFVSQFWQPLDDKTIQDLRKGAENRVRALLEAIP